MGRSSSCSAGLSSTSKSLASWAVRKTQVRTADPGSDDRLSALAYRRKAKPQHLARTALRRTCRPVPLHRQTMARLDKPPAPNPKKPQPKQDAWAITARLCLTSPDSPAFPRGRGLLRGRAPRPTDSLRCSRVGPRVWLRSPEDDLAVLHDPDISKVSPRSRLAGRGRRPSGRGGVT